MQPTSASQSPHKVGSYAYKIDEWMKKNFRVSLVNLSKKLEYNEAMQQILSTDENNKAAMVALYKANKATFDEFNGHEISRKRRGDKRTWTEYFKGVIAGWLFEDLFVLWLQSNGLDANLTGTDNDRVLKVNGVTTDSDVCIRRGDVSRRVELIFEFNDILNDKGLIEKRSPALVTDHKEKAIALYINLKHNQYVLIDTAVEKVKLHLRYHDTSDKCWDKDVHRYILAENGKTARPLEQLFDELWDCCEKSALEGEQPELEEIIDTDSPPKYYTTGGIKQVYAAKIAARKVREAELAKAAEEKVAEPAAIATPKVEEKPKPDIAKEETPKAPPPQKKKAVVQKAIVPKRAAPPPPPPQPPQEEEFEGGLECDFV